MTTTKQPGRPFKQVEPPTQPKRAPGRPKRAPRDFVRTTINFDTDLYRLIEDMSIETGIPTARVINAILRAFVNAQNTTIELGIVGAVGSVTVPNRWPTSRTDDEIRAQYPKEDKA